MRKVLDRVLLIAAYVALYGACFVHANAAVIFG